MWYIKILWHTPDGLRKWSQMWSKRVSKVPWFQHDCLRQESWTSSMRCTCSLQPWHRSHDVETFDISRWCQLWAEIFGIALNACEEIVCECWVDYSDSYVNHQICWDHYTRQFVLLWTWWYCHTVQSQSAEHPNSQITTQIYWMHWRTGSRILWSCTSSWVMYAVKPLLTGAVRVWCTVRTNAPHNNSNMLKNTCKGYMKQVFCSRVVIQWYPSHEFQIALTWGMLRDNRPLNLSPFFCL